MQNNRKDSYEQTPVNNFSGVWIPANILCDKRLSAIEKMMLSQIMALSEKTGYCFASNGYFAKLFDVSSRQVQRILNTLFKYELIILNEAKSAKRTIQVVGYNQSDHDKNVIVNQTSNHDKNVIVNHDKNVIETMTKMSPIKQSIISDTNNNKTNNENKDGEVKNFDIHLKRRISDLSFQFGFDENEFYKFSEKWIRENKTDNEETVYNFFIRNTNKILWSYKTIHEKN